MGNEVLTRNNVKILGDGEKVIIFVHGYGCDQSMWRYIVPAFSEDYKIILLDLVGCGNSDESAYDYEKYATLNGYVTDLLEICNHLKIEKATLVGHSISANISVLASIQNADLFEKLVLVCPSPKFIDDNDYKGGFSQEDIDELIQTLEANYLGWSKAIAPVIMGDHPERPELSAELENSFCRNNPEISKHFAQVTFLCDNREDFKNLKTKTLIIQSEKDNLAAVGVGKYIHKLIENSELAILKTIGHCPHLSAPEMTTAALQSFINT